MKLEPANIICPKCGSTNYMRHLIGKGVGKLDMKCINCNSYFNFDELYKQKIAEVLNPKPQTNADRIRAMTDEELAKFLGNTEANFPPNCLNGVSVKLCETAWLDWLREEAITNDS